MLNERKIKELQDFRDDFNNQLKLAENRYDDKRVKSLPTELEMNIRDSIMPSKHSRKRNKTKFVKSCELFKHPPPWKPSDGYGDYFENFLLQKCEHDLDPWEIYRINLVKRSFEKQENMLEGKNFVYREQYGKEFDDYSKRIPLTESLSSAGAKIIGSFIKDNENIEQKMRDKEKEIYKYRHSKPPMDINPWKCSNHIITEFSISPGDKVVSFKKEPRKKFLITDPYRIPRKDPDYFEEFKRLY